MGTALFECVSGCMCASTELQAHTLENYSIEKTTSILTSEAEECIIRVTNLEKTLSGENKFKLIALAIVAKRRDTH